MPVALIPSFLFYCYINGITPGPANLCSLSASLNAGKKVALRQWWGIFIGFFIDAMIAVFLIYFVGEVLGKYISYFAYVGAAYIIWLAIHILRSTVSPETSKQVNYSIKTGLTRNLCCTLQRFIHELISRRMLLAVHWTCVQYDLATHWSKAEKSIHQSSKGS